MDKKLKIVANPNNKYIECSKEKITINFDTNIKFYDKSITQLTTLDYTIKSYFYSAIILAEKLLHYDFDDRNTYYNNFLYLPMMFSFRQYVELKMKYLYTYCYEKSFPNTHVLSELRDNLKDTEFYGIFGGNSSIDVCEFIDNLEKAPEYFRYILDKNCQGVTEISIDIKTAEKVIYYCREIEHRCELILFNKKLHEAIAK